MCRLLGYLGSPITLKQLLLDPTHSLVAQSYQPRELKVALLNADGFGAGWYGLQGGLQGDARPPNQGPYVYRNILPIWNDPNLPDLCRYVQTPAALAYIRSATPGQPVAVSNCQPFRFQNLLFVHNGFIDNFRQTLYRPIRDQLCDTAYQHIHGTTDSEHIFALLVHQIVTQPDIDLVSAVTATVQTISHLAKAHHTRAMMALIVSDGRRMVAALHDTTGQPPSFYWLSPEAADSGAADVPYSNSVVFASEPLDPAPWQSFPANHLISVAPDLTLTPHALSVS